MQLLNASSLAREMSSMLTAPCVAYVIISLKAACASERSCATRPRTCGLPAHWSTQREKLANCVVRPSLQRPMSPSMSRQYLPGCVGLTDTHSLCAAPRK